MLKRERRATTETDRKRFGIPKTDLEEFLSDPLDAKHYISRCAVEDCEEDLWQRTPLCKEHAYDMWFKVVLEIDEPDHEKERNRAAERRAKKQFDDDEMFSQKAHESFAAYRGKPRSSKPGIIYYLQVGELIKIGYTAYLEERIKTYPPGSKILALHPGTLVTERQIHNKFFNNLAHRREWFELSETLQEHIRLVHEQFPKHNVF